MKKKKRITNAMNMLTQNSCNAKLQIKLRLAFLIDLITVEYFEFK